MNCTRCKKRSKQSEHFNAKYCGPCRRYLLKKPNGRLTPEQRAHARELIGKLPREEIAKEIGVSLSALKRAFRGVRLAHHNKYVVNPNLVKEVCGYYEKHGRIKTQKRFPQVRVRSIIERYKYFKPRQVRWTDRQLIKAAKMAGLISFTQMANYFNRPNAREGSIKSLFMKRFGFGGGNLHGMSHWEGKRLVTVDCPILETNFWVTRRNQTTFGRKLYLWCDMESHLKPDLPKFITEAVCTMAVFQRWLFKSNESRSVIVRLIRNHEKYSMFK